MTKYILKYEVCNYIDFPAGTIVKLIDKENFIVVSGKLKGQKGRVVDGLESWLLEDTAENRNLFKQFEDEKKEIVGFNKNVK